MYPRQCVTDTKFPRHNIAPDTVSLRSGMKTDTRTACGAFPLQTWLQPECPQVLVRIRIYPQVLYFVLDRQTTFAVGAQQI